MARLRALALCLAAAAAAPPALPHRRTRFVASTNGHAESYQPVADLLIAHAASWNVASAYCSSPGHVTNDTVLPSPPFCYSNWTLPIRAAAPHVVHLPIIQMLGDSGPLNFKTPYVFAAKYVAWAVTFNFTGYLLDAEFSGDDAAFEAFLNVFADALHAAGKRLDVFLYPSLGKAPFVNASRADGWLGTWAGKCSTVPDFLWGLNPYYGKGGMMLYQRDAACSGAGVADVFATLNETRASEVGFWANGADMGASWYDAMEAFLAGGNRTGAGGVRSQ